MYKKGEKFTFETVVRVYREERKSTGLTSLPPKFYKNLMDYIEKLHESYFVERKKDPTSSKTVMLEDEHNKAQKRASEIYEIRERKIALLALSAVNDGNPNLKQLAEEERVAFDNIVATLSKNRSKILFKNEEDACESKTFLKSEQEQEDIKVVNEKRGENLTKKNREVEKEEVEETLTVDVKKEYPVLLILEDIPSFETEERTFNLKKDDAISLPKDVAKILCKHGKARVIQFNEKNVS